MGITLNQWGGTQKGIPEYTYTGVAEPHVDGDNWWIEFKTSGTLVFTKLKGAKLVDISAVGGGAGGGGAYRNISGRYYSTGSGGDGGEIKESYRYKGLKVNTPYEIAVGDGGSAGTNGTSTSSVRVSNGSPGGVSKFGNILIANGGKGGAAATGQSSGTHGKPVTGSKPFSGFINRICGEGGRSFATGIIGERYDGAPNTGNAGNGAGADRDNFGLAGKGGSGALFLRNSR